MDEGPKVLSKRRIPKGFSMELKDTDGGGDRVREGDTGVKRKRSESGDEIEIVDGGGAREPEGKKIKTDVEEGEENCGNRDGEDVVMMD